MLTKMQFKENNNRDSRKERMQNKFNLIYLVQRENLDVKRIKRHTLFLYIYYSIIINST